MRRFLVIALVACLIAVAVGQQCWNPPRDDGRCGARYKNAGCNVGQCCNSRGRCGEGRRFCNSRSRCAMVEPAETQRPPKTSLPLVPLDGGNANLVRTALNWCGQRKLITLSFDDGPVIDPDSTRQLLVDLRRLNIKASFFLAPRAAERDLSNTQCDLLHEMINDGHGVHSHSMTHPSFLQLSNDEIQQQLDDWRQWYAQCRGARHDARWLFRPPFGDLDQSRREFINQLGFTVTTWNVDSLDWQGGDADTVFQRSINAFEGHVPSGGSALILHHDAAYTPEGTRGILEKYDEYFRQQRGYQFVTADQCLNACSQDRNCKLPDVWPGVYDE